MIFIKNMLGSRAVHSNLRALLVFMFIQDDRLKIGLNLICSKFCVESWEDVGFTVWVHETLYGTLFLKVVIGF